MQLILNRRMPSANSTPGELFVDGSFFCYTLERTPSDPEWKCIPAGTYEVTLRKTYNPRLWTPYPDEVLPHIENVPGRQGIEMHAGNRAADSEGCVLCGYERQLDIDMIGASRAAVKDLIDRMRAKGGTFQIVVKNAE